MSVISVRSITKDYGSIRALDNVSLTFESNKIYGILGRNGAGKTTLLDLITNRKFPTTGEITIDNQNVYENDAVLEKIFYMSEKNLYPENMKVRDMFKWTKEFYPTFDLDYAKYLCEKFELNLNKKIKALSTGYSSIAKLITSLATNAEILIFDEPILGLDAYHRDLFYKELLANYIEKPKTIIISTHIIEEIADILERVIIIKDKSIAVDDSVENLLKTAYSVSGSADRIEKFIMNKRCVNIDQMASYKSATIVGEVTDIEKELAEQLNLEISKVELQKLFIHLTNGGGVK